MFSVFDSFSGAGGFSLGFQLAGCDIIGALEIDQWACDTFSYNHPQATVINRDIQQISDKEVVNILKNQNIDILLGGPPCQGFSICNRNAGDPKDPRNSLFQEFIRLGKLFHPKVMVMENVPNLLSAKTHYNTPVIQIIIEEMECLGYFVNYQVLEAIDFGVPQIRKRLFIIGTQKKLESPFPIPTYTNQKDTSLFDSLKQCPTLWDAISDLPIIDACEGSEEMDYTQQPKNEYQALLRNDSLKLYNHKAMMHSKRMIERFSSMKCGDTVNDVPDHLKPLRRNGNGQFSDKLYDQNNRRLHPNKQSHTIPASFYANFVHPYQNRNFTPREGARIQSFPDNYRFLGKPTVVSQKLLEREGRSDEKHLCQYNQIGNAVPPLLSKAVAINIINQL